MLNFAVYLQLKDLLRGVSPLSDFLKRGVGTYAREAEKFLSSLQKFTDEQRLPLSSDIAVELQKLMTFDARDAHRSSSAKARDSFAAICIEKVVDSAKKYLEKYDKTYDDCCDACRQLAAQIVTFNQGILAVNAADSILSAARTTDALKPYYAQLVGMVGIFNLRAVLSYVLPETRLN